MVLPLILVALVVVALAIMYWYITLPIIIIIVLIWKYKSSDSDKKEDNESRREQSDSYQNYSQSNYEESSQSRRSQSSSYQNYSQSDYSNYNQTDDDYKKNTQDHSYQKSKSKSKRKSKSKSKASQAKAKRVNDRLEKFQISPDEAKIIFGRTWRTKLGKQEWEFYYTVRYIEIDIEFDYNNRARKKFGQLYSKVLQIIQIVMEENADMREEEGKYYKYPYDDYDYKHHYDDDSDIDDEDIVEAFDTFGLTRESTKEQIKTKYRELTLKFHPDKNKSKNTTVKMTEINRAYEIIMGAIA